MKRVITYGTYDLFHEGQLQTVKKSERARRLFIVGSLQLSF